MVDRSRLWAKSWKEDSHPPRSAYLHEHLLDVYHAATEVVKCTGNDQLKALGLPPIEYEERLRSTVTLAAAVHDLGKANDHFQGMITKQRNIRQNPQGLRHEWATLLMIQELRAWLAPALVHKADWNIVEWAVAGHHPKHGRRSPPNEVCGGGGSNIELLMGHDDYKHALVQIQKLFYLVEPPVLTDLNFELTGFEDVHVHLKKWLKKECREFDQLSQADQRFAAAVKQCLIAADVAGSAIPKLDHTNPKPWAWIAEAFNSLPNEGDFETVCNERLGVNKPRKFQEAVAESSASITFVKAGCGSGKTLAAYLRAAKQHPTRRLYFCYPTTGTATEGFRDYLFDPESLQGRAGAKLFHSRRDIDFEIILGTGDEDVVDESTKIESLESWSTPVVSCTVDTVLGVMQNNKRGLFGWPALSQSAFVFDEIHAFDDKLFGALLRFLKDIEGIPVLLMTASLPAAREAALQRIVESRGEQWQPIVGPVELEERPRYHFLDSFTEPMSAIAETLAINGKVLWVCNTVQRVMDAGILASEFCPILYHSRFKYADRVKRHQAVIDAFDPSKNIGPALAICSQVAEMSLDLSADLLVTDVAPIPSLIQRLGRLNRRADEGDPTKPFVVMTPDFHLPYEEEQLTEAQSWLMKLQQRSISQRDLTDAWEQTQEEVPTPGASAWMDGGPVTEVDSLRSLSKGVSVLLKSDLAQVNQNPRSMAKFIIPMPECKDHDWRSWKRLRGIPICEDSWIDYDPIRGAVWQK